MDTPEDILKLGAPDPEQAAIFETLGPAPALDWNDIDAVRQPSRDRAKAVVKMMGPPEPHCTEEWIEIPSRDAGRSIPAKLTKPTQPTAGGNALCILYYGGGFIMGEPNQMTMYARNIVQQYGATVLLPAYRLGPEHPFPAAPHDVWDVVVWAGQHATELGADAARGFIVGGVSAGANLSAAIGAKYVDEGLQPPLTGLWLSVPLIYADRAHVPEEYHHLYLSMEQNADTPILSVDTMREMRKLYAPETDSLLYSVGLRTGATSRMPPVYFQVCGMDPLRDDALIYAAVLRRQGRKTLVHTYPGLVHAAWTFFPAMKASQQAKIDFNTGFGWLLGKGPRGAPQDGPAFVAAGA